MSKFNYKSHKGFSLLEGVVIFIVGSIVLTAALNTYINFVKLDRQQQRILVVDRELLSVQSSLKKDLTSLPGRGLATSYGLAFGTPTLPAAGSIRDLSGKNTPIQLGIITPYKINGQDAFTIAYADAKAPRMVLAEASQTLTPNAGKVKIALPLSTAPQASIPPNPKTGTPTSGTGSSTGGPRSISTTGDNSSFNIQKGGSSPSPEPSPSSSPTPRGTESPAPSPSATPIPPDVPYTETLHQGLSWIPSSETIKSGELMLLVAAPLATVSKTPTQTAPPVQVTSRLVRILSVTGGVNVTNSSSKTPNGNTIGRQFIEVTYDFCSGSDCEQQSNGLVNPADAPSTFQLGSILVPIKFYSYYWKSDRMSSRVVRNVGGLILPDGNGGFRVQGGTEETLGESDSLSVSYQLRDGSTQLTPNNPLVVWLKDITSVNVEISREVPSLQGKDPISRKITLNYPLIIRNLE